MGSWLYRRQPGHYTRFGVTSGWPVTRVEPRHRLLPLFELSPSRLGEYSVLKRLHRYSLSHIY